MCPLCADLRRGEVPCLDVFWPSGKHFYLNIFVCDLARLNVLKEKLSIPFYSCFYQTSARNCKILSCHGIIFQMLRSQIVPQLCEEKSQSCHDIERPLNIGLVAA